MNSDNLLRGLFLLFTLVGGIVTPVSASAADCVILLHGLNRSVASLDKMQEALHADGYHVINVDYPSRYDTVETLATEYLGRAVADCRKVKPERIHFVTHSMGGILVRYYLAHASLDELGRVVMLGPPNQGSEVVDSLRDVPGFEVINGPAGRQLGTDQDGIPQQLGRVNYPVGVITGNRSINLVLSTLIPGDDDGKVSVERAKVEGMTDFLVVPHTHPMIMRSDRVIHQTICFLRNGKFERDTN